MKHIGILGGAFSPPHKSHKAIADECINQRIVDEVWVMPAFNHVQKKNITATFEQRIKMCDLLFGGLFSKIKVKNFEKLNIADSLASGTTYNLLRILEYGFPKYRFTIIIGQDAADNIQTWYRHEELLKNYCFIVFERRDYFCLKPNEWYLKSPHKVIKLYQCFISSTFIRNLFSKEHFNLIELLTSKKLLKYILKEKINYENC